MKIKYINYGTGNRVGNIIYLNKDLKKYPKLHDAILKHEIKHTGMFSMFDFNLDLTNKDLAKVKNEWWSFIIKYPRAWVNFLPVLKLGSSWCFDVSIIIVWGIIIFLILLGWYLI